MKKGYTRISHELAELIISGDDRFAWMLDELKLRELPAEETVHFRVFEFQHKDVTDRVFYTITMSDEKVVSFIEKEK